MVVGDVVNDISADNTIIIFQPAVGVEAVITWVGVDGQNTVGIVFTDGVLFSGWGTGFEAEIKNVKHFINNTNFFRINALGATFNGSFTGIQTQ